MKNNFKKLPKSLKRKWLTALRSGKYKQGEGYLRQKNYHNKIEYCCLGVLCDVAKVYPRWDSAFIYSRKLPSFMRDQNELTGKLSSMNDSKKDGKHKFSFKRIANWIEKNL